MIITDINILRKPNEKVNKEEIDFLIKKLEEELSLTENGIGLAAPQIGINKTIAIIRTDSESINLINPQIIEMKDLVINKGEACLSFPNKYINTYRFREIFIIDDLHPAGFVATDFIAIALFHEIDHLNSILMIDREVKGKLGRNDLCPCGKNIKFKHCHGK